ncbi:DUF4270 family protein [Echinicola jeungdonensis]|uniref:DUF4270 family protein n=1 Tax=Echinicola jeungdonensis TaxID=709343 RepID=A0ABV5J4H2_9BACT|nr:DUF4270 family protein [Echinicola jeungdonensis]MDN3669026.1 DUF4270 family protein [Echinicola jeungdonensis]
MKVTTTSITNLPAKLACSLLLSLTFASSCTDPTDIGLELDPNTNQIGVFYKEIPLSASLVLIDSVNTTNSSVLVAGGDISSYFGRTESIGYSRMAFNPVTTKPGEDAIFDSARFDLNIIGLTSEDMDELKSFSAHQLTEPILDTVYYNFDQLAYEETAFATGSFELEANSDTTVSMVVEEAFAQDLFSKLQNNDPVFENIFTFRDYFPGFALKGNPDEETTLTIQMGSSTGMRLYYHSEGDTTSTAYNITTFQSRHFNGVISDRTGTPTEIVQVPNTAYDPGELAGSKANLGLILKLDMEPLRTFLDTAHNINLNQASLEMGPTENFSDSKLPPSNLIMYFADENNKIQTREADGALLSVQRENAPQVATDSEGNYIPAVSSGGSSALIFDSEKYIYQQQITSYINALYRFDELDRTDLLLYPRTPSNPSYINDLVRSLREYIVNQNSISLKIYYSKLR